MLFSLVAMIDNEVANLEILVAIKRRLVAKPEFMVAIDEY